MDAFSPNAIGRNTKNVNKLNIITKPTTRGNWSPLFYDFLPYGLAVDASPPPKPIRLRGGSGGAESCLTR